MSLMHTSSILKPQTPLGMIDTYDWQSAAWCHRLSHTVSSILIPVPHAISRLVRAPRVDPSNADARSQMPRYDRVRHYFAV